MEKLTTVYLVRHGQTAANQTGVFQGQTDVPLDETGREQARLVGARLRELPFDRILASDLSRAAVTAEAIAGGREILFRRELREWNLGEWSGLTFAQVAEKFPEEYREFAREDTEGRVSGGESRKEFFARAARVLDGLVREFAGRTILCVTHGGMIRAMFAAAAGFMPRGRFIRTDNAGLSCLRYFHESESWQLVAWNDCSHLRSDYAVEEKFPFK